MMKLTSVCVEGFRLLERIDIAIENGATVIVGRNNSGKTSLTEVFDRFLGEQAGRFRLEDFAAVVRPKFLTAKARRDSEESTPDIVLAELGRGARVNRELLNSVIVRQTVLEDRDLIRYAPKVE